MELRYLLCCGVREITDLRETTDSADALNRFRTITRRDGENFRYAIFTQAGLSDEGYAYGEEFAAFIVDNKLGAVTETEGRHKNPNSGNILKCWIWTVNHSAVRGYARPVKKRVYKKKVATKVASTKSGV
jgi:hypothetical protein